MAKLHELDPAAKFGVAQEWTVAYALATSQPRDLRAHGSSPAQFARDLR